MSVVVALAIILALIAGNAFFVALEFALVAADKTKLETEASNGNWTAQSAIKALKKLSFHLSGAQLGITITSLVLGLLSERVVGGLLEPITSNVGFLQGEGASIIFALVVATIFQMVLGELIPKNLAIAGPERVSKLLSPVAAVVNGALTPIIKLFNGAANGIVRMLGLEPKEELSEVMDLNDISYLARAESTEHSGEESEGLKSDTKLLLGRTVKFGDKTCADALTPRLDIKHVSKETTVSDFLVQARQFGFSRYPVTDNDVDKVVGQVKVADTFKVPFQERSTTTLADVMSPPLVVPETKELIELIVDFDKAGTELAIVFDEHGGTEGILTFEDVLEEIIGEIDDEHDDHEHLTRALGEGRFSVAGSLHPDEVEESVGFKIPEGPYETIAGFFLAEFQNMAEVGSTISHEGWDLTVTELDGRRISAIDVAKQLGEAE